MVGNAYILIHVLLIYTRPIRSAPDPLSKLWIRFFDLRSAERHNWTRGWERDYEFLAFSK